VFEQAGCAVLIEAMSRARTQGLGRHRHLSYSQLSQRYVDESEVGFVLPPEIEEGTEAFEIWRRSCERSLEEYRALLARIEEQVKDEPSAPQRRKRARQEARSGLPTGAEAKSVDPGDA